MERIYNIVKAMPDSRDFLLKNLIEIQWNTIPNIIDNRVYTLDIRDQENSMMCAAFSACSIKECQEVICNGITDLKMYEYLSPRWIYSHRENIDTDGMNIRDVMKILLHVGVVKEITMPFNSDFDTIEEISGYLDIEASRHRISRYTKCTTIEDTCAAIYRYGACIVSVPVWDTPIDSIYFWKPKDKESKMIGGHAMVLLGYNKTGLVSYFIIRNSWGPRWGDKGYAYFPFADFGYIWDIYNICYKEETKKELIDTVTIPDRTKCCMLI